MSIDTKSPIDANPIAHAEPPKSSRRFWLGGCGCLGLLAVLCLGGGVFAWMKVGLPLQQLLNETTETALSSEKAIEVLGEPITAGTQSVAQDQNTPGKINVRIPVTGSKAAGEIVMVAAFVDGKWEREDMHLNVEGEKIDLDTESQFELNIDDGL